MLNSTREPGRLRVHVWSGEVTIDLFEGAPADLTRQLGARFGPRQALPDWALGGAIVGLKQGEASFERLEALIEAGAAVSGLWCEDWVGIRETSFGRRLFWDWQWSAERYPDLPARIAALKARGIRFLGYVNPYLAVDGPLYPRLRPRATSPHALTAMSLTPSISASSTQVWSISQTPPLPNGSPRK